VAQNPNILSPMTFSSFLGGHKPCPPPMPLIHSTDFAGFREIMRVGKLAPTRCDVFHEDLLYFFYGRPAYRVSAEVVNGLQEAYMPISIIMEPEIAISVSRIFPFDSGAFQSRLFQRFIPKNFSIDSYQLGTRLDLPQQVVSAFFGSNEKYMEGKVQMTQVPTLELEVSHYYRLISDPSVSFNDNEPFPDDRRYSIEVQSTDEVPLREFSVNKAKRRSRKRENLEPLIMGHKVRAVIVPRNFMRASSIRSTITKTWRAKALPYDYAEHQNPKVVHGAVWQVASQYLRRARFL
jgi:hypothetical protein